jgi:hypothetical protein
VQWIGSFQHTMDHVRNGSAAFNTQWINTQWIMCARIFWHSALIPSAAGVGPMSRPPFRGHGGCPGEPSPIPGGGPRGGAPRCGCHPEVRHPCSPFHTDYSSLPDIWFLKPFLPPLCLFSCWWQPGGGARSEEDDRNKSLYLVFVGVVFLSILDCF